MLDFWIFFVVVVFCLERQDVLDYMVHCIWLNVLYEGIRVSH